MADHIFEHHEVVSAYRYASTWWRSLAGAVEDHQWDQPGLGEWNVRELVAHTDRVFKTLLDYSEGDVKDPTEIYSAAAYFRIVLAEQTPHVHIAARAKREAAETDGWVSATDDLAARAGALVERSAPDLPMHLMVGEMQLDQYLATRVVELVVHGLDLSRALALPTSAPVESARVALTVLLDLASGDDVSQIVRLLTGRTAELPLTHVLS
ncbi:MAG: maleylpyruvate isomerase N-terminal domain-containing protein [Actinobacteria bacterium]|nr:maleylpyruvate isomerase N-terminal domain-containing protein [Actinomycetota bacterium]